MFKVIKERISAKLNLLQRGSSVNKLERVAGNSVNAGRVSLVRGFTLIELLVVIGILAVLLAITLIAINPARQFSQANNTKRRNDVNSILNAIDQYAADNNGKLPASFPTTATDIGNGAGQVDICAAITPKYLAALPSDPSVNNGNAITSCSPSYDTGYQVLVDSSGSNRVTVSAPDAELSATISVTR